MPAFHDSFYFSVKAKDSAFILAIEDIIIYYQELNLRICFLNHVVKIPQCVIKAHYKRMRTRSAVEGMQKSV